MKHYTAPSYFCSVEKVASENQPWIMGPAYVFPFPKGEWQQVIHQCNEYSCGPIAVLHVLMLCGLPLRPKLFAADWKKQHLCQELFWEGIISISIMDLLIGFWVSEAVPPESL